MKSNWSIWKIIKLGTHRDFDALRISLNRADMKINYIGNNILGKPAFRVGSTEANVILARKTVADLGFVEPASYKAIRESIVGQTTIIDGLEYDVCLCPAEVGPQLRLQYADQPDGEQLRVAMKSIENSNGHTLFNVEHEDYGLWLLGESCDDNILWDVFLTFLFCLNKKKSV